jgi:dihydropteroate synthase
MIYKVLETDPESALNGTTVLHTLAILNGANLCLIL